MSESPGSYIAWYCGDTFIRFEDNSPVAQWDHIVKMLRANGFDITAKKTTYTPIDEVIKGGKP